MLQYLRTRHKSYIDYGITESERKYIENYCRNASEEEKEFIKVAISITNLDTYIQQYIFFSLTEKLSYEKICARKDYLYIGKSDFYGYRRKAMEGIKRWMTLNNILEFEE